ncbi:cell cycle checkpoint protein RAD1 [Tribolium castaneum]|uniref:Cell cycle checkpoint protein RAD1-like Protein n=1 Tax=Tribolium castaneum TaxID=7070 RepID=D6X3Z8_TRICA|nr:PREDICTED: cell cycle checkpoint protein RAD1 [Tribolium castaneum]EEZ97345.1 Cell cycle checkpoint protein RAD1-like Protein [Tribolium castaneum]|eukprot:XP_969960.1 PREDICTED: cell cycle checkpoint protein RAD1 [Tribolium castaneum]
MLFSAEISDFRTVHNVLRAISFKDYAILRPTEEGLKFTLEEMKSVEISAYVPRNMFSYYRIADNADVSFKISMKVFTECLNIFGDEGNPSIKLSYKNEGAPLCLIVKHSEENITVDCEIKTLNADDSPDFSLAEECNLNKVVFNANMLTEVLQRLDNGADDITISLNPDPPHFTLSTTGIAGESKVNIPRQSDSITIFQCQKKSSWKYAFHHIRQILKVMNYANKVAVFSGETGLLGLQLVINSDERQMYVEYYVTSLFGDG